MCANNKGLSIQNPYCSLTCRSDYYPLYLPVTRTVNYSLSQNVIIICSEIYRVYILWSNIKGYDKFQIFIPSSLGSSMADILASKTI